MSEKIRKRFCFHGRVQGVGFRWTCIHEAMSLGLTGWVRNERDQTVIVEVQGDQNSINNLISFMKKDRYIRIDWVDEEDLATENNESSFTVRYR